MSELIFAAPVWNQLVVALAAVVVFIAGNRRQDALSQRVGIGLFAAALVWGVTAWIVDTPTETCEKGTRRFIAAVVDKDDATMRELMHPSATLKLMDYPISLYTNATDIAQSARNASETYGVQSARITRLVTQTLDSMITINFTAFSTQTATMGRPLQTNWQFEWQDLGDGWQLYSIVCLQVQGMSADEAAGHFPRRP